MLELLSFIAAVGITGYLARPFLRRRPLPVWLERARLRGRPGVPVTAWLSAVLLMWVVWLIGERRGIFGFLLWLVWIGGPLVASFLTVLWVKRGTKGEEGAPSALADRQSAL